MANIVGAPWSTQNYFDSFTKQHYIWYVSLYQLSSNWFTFCCCSRSHCEQFFFSSMFFVFPLLCYFITWNTNRLNTCVCIRVLIIRYTAFMFAPPYINMCQQTVVKKAMKVNLLFRSVQSFSFQSALMFLIVKYLL